LKEDIRKRRRRIVLVVESCNLKQANRKELNRN